MAKRSQRRHKAILPVKITSNGTLLVGHTLDISAFGARVVVLSELESGSSIRIEYKHRRVVANVAWCRPMKGRKYEFEAGLKMQTDHSDFWGVILPETDIDRMSNFPSDIPVDVVTLVSPKRTYGE